MKHSGVLQINKSPAHPHPSSNQANHDLRKRAFSAICSQRPTSNELELTSRASSSGGLQTKCSSVDTRNALRTFFVTLSFESCISSMGNCVHEGYGCMRKNFWVTSARKSPRFFRCSSSCLGTVPIEAMRYPGLMCREYPSSIQGFCK